MDDEVTLARKDVDVLLRMARAWEDLGDDVRFAVKGGEWEAIERVEAALTK